LALTPCVSASRDTDTSGRLHSSPIACLAAAFYVLRPLTGDQVRNQAFVLQNGVHDLVLEDATLKALPTRMPDCLGMTVRLRDRLSGD
jgi:hypothetical protein